MSTDTKPPAPTAKPAPAAKAEAADAKPEAKAAEVKPAARPVTKPPGKLPPLDERLLKFADLAPYAAQLDAAELIAMLRDGRGVVRANAALGLAAVNQPVLDVVMLLRDSEPRVAVAASESIGLLGALMRPLLPQVAQALDGALPEVLEAVVGTFSELIGKADDELIAGLDVPFPLAMKTIVEAAGRLGKPGIAFLIAATRHERGRVRINAIGGLGRWGKADIDASMACLTDIEANDSVPDVRSAAKQASLAVIARPKVAAVDGLPKNIPDFEERKLGASELSEYADAIDVDQMIYALNDGRAHVRINAARALATKGERAGRAAPNLGLACRDSIAQVRREAAKALGKLGADAAAAAADLVGALSDVEAEVADAAAETLEPMGGNALDALLTKGLATGSVSGGWRVGELISKQPNAAEVLTEAFRSPAVNVQVNAAIGLGMLGPARVGAGLAALHGARTGGDARTREAVFKALGMLFPAGEKGPAPVTVDGFEDRFLTAAELDGAKAQLQAVGVADFIEYLQDGRDAVRGNAAGALGALGAAAAGAATTLGVRLRDDAPRVRLAAAQALDRIGDAAVLEVAGDLVRALGDADERVAEQCAAVIKARKGRMIGPLVRGLETDGPIHARRIAELINVFDDATELLCDAFDSPAVNVQVNAALALGMLGPKRIGKGRKALEGARTGGWERTREAVRTALAMLDGPRRTGPAEIAIEGFEVRVLGAEAFANASAKLAVIDLIDYLRDGRSHVRANAATALGTLGAAAAGAALPIAVLMRDDDTRVRVQAAAALDKLGDGAVRETAEYLVGALRGDPGVTAAVAPVLVARKARVLGALLKGLETDDETHARRILEVINVLPDAPELLVDAIESPAENVQVNTAIGLGMLGEKRAGAAGRKALETRRTGGFARTREAVFKALAMWKT